MAETNITKNKEGYGYKYTDLAQIHEYLEQNNMRYYQYVETVDGKDYIMTVPIIDGVEQKPRRGVQIVDAVLNGIKNPAQEQGSATTYARRYSLLMAFGLATEDDDGQALTKQTSNTKKQNEPITLEEAESMKLNFGKYKGMTLKELSTKDGKYCDWLYSNEKTDTKIKQALNVMLTEKKKEKRKTENEIKEEQEYIDPFTGEIIDDD